MTIEEVFKKWLEEKPMAKILVTNNSQMGYILEFAEYYHKQEIFKLKSLETEIVNMRRQLKGMRQKVQILRGF
jgi:hypothetical protein